MKMRFICLLLLATIGTNAQKSTDWWQPGNYIKIPITKKGIYQIPLSRIQTLLPANSNAIQTTDFKLFRHGKAVNIFASGQSIEFYGEPNNGKPDAEMYLKPSDQANDFTSMYTDTAFYYLQHVPSAGLAKPIQPDAQGVASVAYHFEKQRTVLASSWTFNPRTGPVPTLESPYLDEGEGFSGPMIQKGVLNVLNIQLLNYEPTAGFVPNIKIQLNGRDEFQHEVTVKAGLDTLTAQIVDTVSFTGFQFKSLAFNVNTPISSDARFVVATRSGGPFAFDRYSINYYEVVYPQLLVATTEPKTYYFKPNNTSLKPNITLIGGLVAYRIGDKTEKFSNEIIIEKSNTETEIFVGMPIELKTMEVVKFISFENIAANYVIITHPSFNQAAEGFAKYRSSADGGAYQTAIFNIRNLYDQFNYGIRGPLAIRNFLTKLTNTDPKNRYLLLIGQGTSIFDNKFRANPEANDRVPTWGFPGSDNALSAGINGASPLVSRFPTGRISTFTNQNALNYLNKVIENEKPSPDNLWRKRILHLSGGRSVAELQYFKNILDGFQPTVLAGAMGGRTEIVGKQTIDPVEKINVSNQVNEGVGLISFFGHSSPAGADIDIGIPNDASRGFQNQGKYPVLFLNGCGLGNSFYGASPFASQWVNAANKGAIASLSHTAAGYTFTLSQYMKTFYDVFNEDKFLSQSLGQIQQETATRVTQAFPDDFSQSNALLMCIQGDPAVKFYQPAKPDYELNDNQLFIQSGSIEPIINGEPQLGIILTNAGKFSKTKKTSLRVQVQGQAATTYNINDVSFRDTIIVKFERPPLLEFTIQVTVDPDKQTPELNEQNNSATININWPQLGTATLFPENIIPDRIAPRVYLSNEENSRILLNNQTIVEGASVRINLQDDRILKQDKTEFQVQLKNCETCGYKTVESTATWNYNSSKSVSLSLKDQFTSSGSYTIQVQGFDAARNQAFKEPLVYTLNVIPVPVKTTASIYPNPAVQYFTVSVLADQSQPLSLELIDMTGKNIFSNQKSIDKGLNEWTIDLNTLAASNGLYIVKIKNALQEIIHTDKIFISR